MQCQKHLFQLENDVSYLNCAYMSPQLRRVEAAGHGWVSRKNRPYEIHPEDFFTQVEQVKQLFAELVQVQDPERIALIPSVSYGMATVARNMTIKSGQRIVVAGEQFPSNYYPWQRLAEAQGAEMVEVAAPPSKRRGAAWNEALLTAIDERTALVALSHCHWADGTVFDLEDIRKKSREVGALLVIDATQSVGALPFDVSRFQPDALICAGYKWLLGPYSTGLAYYGPAFDGGVPIEENWINRYNSQDFQHLVQYQQEYQPGAGRYSVGEQSNFILVPMLAEALSQLLEWEVPHIQQYCRALSAGPLERLQAMGAQVEEPKYRSGHLFGIRLQGQFDIAGLRNQFERERVYVSLRGDAIRIAPHVYNDARDFERLLRCFEAARKAAV